MSLFLTPADTFPTGRAHLSPFDETARKKSSADHLVANVYTDSEPGDYVDKKQSLKLQTITPSCVPIEYRLNKHGFRSDEFANRSTFNLLSIGCDYTFGKGVAYEDTWSYQLSKLIEGHLYTATTNWNLGWAGRSNDYISRMLLTYTEKFNPSLVVVYFTHSDRREYWLDDKTVCGFTPANARHILKFNRGNSEMRRITSELLQLESTSQDAVNFAKNYTLVELHLKLLNIPWLFTLADVSEQLFECVDKERYVPFIPPEAKHQRHLDYGKSCTHSELPSCKQCGREIFRKAPPTQSDVKLRMGNPGARSHSSFAERVFRKAVSLNLLALPPTLLKL